MPETNENMLEYARNMLKLKNMLRYDQICQEYAQNMLKYRKIVLENMLKICAYNKKYA